MAINTPTTWQLSMGPTEYTAIINFLQTYDLPCPFDYLKGNANMKDVPKVGDNVIITCKAKEIAKGIILEGFHTHDRTGVQVATVLVEDIIYDQPYRKGHRRNWTKI